MSRTYNFILENPGSTIQDVVRNINITEDKARYQIKKCGDMLIKSDERPARYRAADNPVEEDEAPVSAPEKNRRGPINPQPLLNKMIATAQSFGVTMEYVKSERAWRFKKGTKEFVFLSRELPALREAGLEDWLKKSF